MKQNERCSAIMARDDGQLPDIAGICNLDTQSWVNHISAWLYGLINTML